MVHSLKRFFPFLDWLPLLRQKEVLIGDIVAGLTVVLFLIPQALAYGKLAGMPAYYGLYAACVPMIVAGLFGSSRQLSTGPVAMASLLTAAALQPLAAQGSASYLSYVFLLAFMAGTIQLGLGVFRFGVVLNFISWPVMLGFTNAAVLIIATSQIGPLLGVSAAPLNWHYLTVFQVLKDAFIFTHWPTVAISLLTLGTVIVFKTFLPRAPGILFAIILATIVAWLGDYEQSRIISANGIINYPLQNFLKQYSSYPADVQTLTDAITRLQSQIDEKTAELPETKEHKLMKQIGELSQLQWQLERLVKRHQQETIEINQLRLRRLTTMDGQQMYYAENHMTPIGEIEPKRWKIVAIIDADHVKIEAGGKVVGFIPRGLPSFQMPVFDLDIVRRLLMAALAIALLGFMEAASIARKIAIATRQQIDMDQELIGQGLAKIAGSFFQSMPVSGGFSRTVINHEAGAKTGFSSIVAGLLIILVLLGATPLFYYLPDAALAMVMVVTVLSLIDFRAMKQIWQVNINEGMICITTFAMTLLLAPKLEYAVIIGVMISLGLYLHESMRPRFYELIQNEDGELTELFDKSNACYLISMVRYGGSLYFANASWFEDKILALIRDYPKLRYIIVDSVSINKIDASGIDMLTRLVGRLEESGIELWFTRMRQPVLDAIKRSGLFEHLGAHHFYKHNDEALDVLRNHLGAKHMNDCPWKK